MRAESEDLAEASESPLILSFLGRYPFLWEPLPFPLAPLLPGRCCCWWLSPLGPGKDGSVGCCWGTLPLGPVTGTSSLTWPEKLNRSYHLVCYGSLVWALNLTPTSSSGDWNDPSVIVLVFVWNDGSRGQFDLGPSGSGLGLVRSPQPFDPQLLSRLQNIVQVLNWQQQKTSSYIFHFEYECFYVNSRTKLCFTFLTTGICPRYMYLRSMAMCSGSISSK